MKYFQIKFNGGMGAQVLEVMFAENMLERMRGLLGRATLEKSQGMLLRSCNLVHTIGMRYPIDVVFLRRDGLVLKVSPAVPPRRAAGHLRAHSVLELVAGEALRCGIEKGKVIPFEYHDNVKG